MAATVSGLLVQDPGQKVALIDPASGRAAPLGIPADATIAGTDADDVAWQAAACPVQCPLHVTGLRGGPDTQIALPPHTSSVPMTPPTSIRPASAWPCRWTHQFPGVIMGTSVYVADLRARTLTKVPGGPIPVAALPAVLGALPAGSSDVVSARWPAAGPGLWIVATDGLYFQAGVLERPGPAPRAPVSGRAGLQVRHPRDWRASRVIMAGRGPITVPQLVVNTSVR